MAKKKNFRKGYIPIILIIAYILFKVYVTYTPSSKDDNLPDDFKNAVLLIANSSADDDLNSF